MRTFSLFLLVFTIFLTFSCGENGSSAPTIARPEPEQPENVITTPCDITLSDITENSRVEIDCLLDLKGESIDLPPNVHFDFGGGDIINGELLFRGGTIDGRLLSNKLTISGDVTLQGDTFKLYAMRWDIVEGPVNSATALKNNAELERLMLFAKQLGANTFEINQFDAYFEVTKVTSTTTNANWYPSLEAVNIPSDFHLKMSDKTHLRLFPADAYNREGGGILAVRDVSNVTVTGGNLHGDRDERVYSPDDIGLEGSHLFLIHSGRNIMIDGVKFFEGSSGTFAIYSFGFSFNPNTYKPTTTVTIKNCVITNSRRMAIALTDARDVLIEGNTFINAGQPSANSDGGEVGYAINIEPARTRDSQGNLLEYQKAFDILIRGNKETGSRGGFLTMTIGQDITVEDNDIGTRVVSSLVSGSKIINNRFKASGTAIDSWAIFAAGGDSPTVFSNEVAWNTISGYSLGIATGTTDVQIHDNTITECGMGIQVSRTFNSRIFDNTIDAAKYGIAATNTYNDTVEITGNEVSSGLFHIYLANMNHNEGQENYTVTIDSNIFLNTGQGSFSNASGIIFNNNDIAGGIQIGNLSKMTVSGNVIRPDESDGIRLYNTHSEVSILNNTISEPTGALRYVCINNNSETPDAITMTGNTCR